MARLARLTVLFMAHAMGTANVTLVLAFAPLLQRELQLTPAGFGVSVACYYAAQTIVALPCGWFMDRFGIRRTLIVSHVLLAAGMALIACSIGQATLTLGLTLCGAGYAFVNPATAWGVLAWFDVRHRATAMGAKQTGVPLGAVGLATIAAAAGEEWRALAFGLSAATLATTLAFLALQRGGQAGASPAPLRDLRQVLTHRRLFVINLASAFYTLALACLLAYFVTFAHDVVHVAASTASLLLAVVQASSATGRIAWGIIADRLPGNGRVTGLVICGFVGAASIAALPLVPGGASLAVLAVALGLTVGGFASLAQTVAVEAVPPHQVGAAVGYNMLTTAGGMVVGPILFAALLGFGGYTLSWWVVAAVLLTGGVLFQLGARARGTAG